MSVSIVRYKIKTATQRDIHRHIMECNNNYIPPLSARVTLHDFARKIFDKAVTFEAWSDDILVGLIAVYFNDPDNIAGYITNVSVLKNYMRMGIASELMKENIEYARKHKFNEIKLEVRITNNSAIKFYKQFGFVTTEIKGDYIHMVITGL